MVVKLRAVLHCDIWENSMDRCSYHFFSSVYHLSLVMREPGFCISENKGADQLRGNREADQRLCFRYIDGTVPLLSKSEISSL